MEASTTSQASGQRSASVGARRRAPSLLAARGEPQVWLMGLAQVVCLVLIVGLLALVAVSGARTFWPGPIERVTLASGEVLLGIPVRRERVATGDRTLYRVGNRDVGQEPFRWIAEGDVSERSRPRHAVLLERREWGVWVGLPRALIDADAGEPTSLDDGLAPLHRAVRDARSRVGEIDRLTREELGGINHELERDRLAVRRSELGLAASSSGSARRLSWGAWSLVALSAVALAAVGGWSVKRRAGGEGTRGTVWRTAVVLGAGAAALATLVERPWGSPVVGAQEHARLVERVEQRRHELGEAYEATRRRIEELRTRDLRHRVRVEDAAGARFAPLRQDSPDEPLAVSSVVRVVAPNSLSWWGKLGVYLDRWGEYLLGEPREANTEGGVFPVIVGTVLLTVLLSVAVVPMGVVGALYLREYARQGPLVSAIRIAVNNLAGVPSIVYGVFGLGFFCYTVGGFVDAGPSSLGLSTPRWAWWLGVGAIVVLLMGATALVGLGRSSVQEGAPRRWAKVLAGVCWLVAGAGALGLAAGTPYFGGFFTERLPSPTFGGRGLLWATLTLALLTLPVVIVATEEALAAVPRSVREGSYGCGASQWQTLRRIVLPQAAPGIMTGAILAMARGAGEVAPLMLVGAMKRAPELPIDGTFPFVHGERSFMHLGFHIYDLGFQSPDSEAARPLVWTTTLLLVSIVLVLNLSAILARNRLRARARGAVV